MTWKIDCEDKYTETYVSPKAYIPKRKGSFKKILQLMIDRKIQIKKIESKYLVIENQLDENYDENFSYEFFNQFTIEPRRSDLYREHPNARKIRKINVYSYSNANELQKFIHKLINYVYSKFDVNNRLIKSMELNKLSIELLDKFLKLIELKANYIEIDLEKSKKEKNDIILWAILDCTDLAEKISNSNLPNRAHMIEKLANMAVVIFKKATLLNPRYVLAFFSISTLLTDNHGKNGNLLVIERKLLSHITQVALIFPDQHPGNKAEILINLANTTDDLSRHYFITQENQDEENLEFELYQFVSTVTSNSIDQIQKQNRETKDFYPAAFAILSFIAKHNSNEEALIDLIEKIDFSKYKTELDDSDSVVAGVLQHLFGNKLEESFYLLVEKTDITNVGTLSRAIIFNFISNETLFYNKLLNKLDRKKPPLTQSSPNTTQNQGLPEWPPVERTRYKPIFQCYNALRNCKLYSEKSAFKAVRKKINAMVLTNPYSDNIEKAINFFNLANQAQNDITRLFTDNQSIFILDQNDPYVTKLHALFLALHKTTIPFDPPEQGNPSMVDLVIQPLKLVIEKLETEYQQSNDPFCQNFIKKIKSLFNDFYLQAEQNFNRNEIDTALSINLLYLVKNIRLLKYLRKFKEEYQNLYSDEIEQTISVPFFKIINRLSFTGKQLFVPTLTCFLSQKSIEDNFKTIQPLLFPLREMQEVEKSDITYQLELTFNKEVIKHFGNTIFSPMISHSVMQKEKQTLIAIKNLYKELQTEINRIVKPAPKELENFYTTIQRNCLEIITNKDPNDLLHTKYSIDILKAINNLQAEALALSRRYPAIVNFPNYNDLFNTIAEVYNSENKQASLKKAQEDINNFNAVLEINSQLQQTITKFSPKFGQDNKPYNNIAEYFVETIKSSSSVNKYHKDELNKKYSIFHLNIQAFDELYKLVDNHVEKQSLPLFKQVISDINFLIISNGNVDLCMGKFINIIAFYCEICSDINEKDILKYDPNLKTLVFNQLFKNFDLYRLLETNQLEQMKVEAIQTLNSRVSSMIVDSYCRFFPPTKKIRACKNFLDELPKYNPQVPAAGRS